jgi:dTDP-4-dehydrorhamnose reductase
MRILLTGASGQIGRALIATASGSDELIGPTREELDIADRDAVVDFVARRKPQTIINAAAYTAVDQAENEPEAARSVNESGATHLAESAASIGARMIQLSTDFVFDGRTSIPYDAAAHPNPLSVYGRTKLAGERAVLTELPDRAIVLRTAWVYAAQSENFVSTMLRLMKASPAVRVVADQIGTPTAADSVADVVWALVTRPQLRGVYHWTDAGVASRYDLAVAISEEASAIGLLDRRADVVPITTVDYPTLAERPGFSVLDTRSTIAATGIVPRHWRDRLGAVLREIRNG